MKYEVQITFEDFRAAQWLHMLSGPSITGDKLGTNQWDDTWSGLSRFGMVLAVRAAAFLVVIPVAYLVFGRGRQRDLWMAGTVMLCGAIWFLVVQRRWRRRYEQQKEAIDPVAYEFTDEAFIVSTNQDKMRFAWRNMAGWKENKHLFLIYGSDTMFNIVPKRIFGSKEEMERLRAMLTKGIGKVSR